MHHRDSSLAIDTVQLLDYFIFLNFRLIHSCFGGHCKAYVTNNTYTYEFRSPFPIYVMNLILIKTAKVTD